jgi:hypothetical protein
MAKSDVEKLTEEKVSKGGVLARLYFDMQHDDKEKLQPLMLDLVNERLMKEKGVVYVYGAIEKPLEKNGTHITSGIITVLMENFQTLVGVVFRYAPAGIEILKPEKGMQFKANELQSLLMDLSQISLDYSRYILEKVMKPDDLANMERNLENRAELGKRIAEKAKKKDDTEQPHA